MGTGNYNPVTGRIYTDLSYFTCDPALGADVADLFNALTGYSRQDKLLVAPMTMRQQLLSVLPVRPNVNASMVMATWRSR